MNLTNNNISKKTISVYLVLFIVLVVSFVGIGYNKNKTDQSKAPLLAEDSKLSNAFISKFKSDESSGSRVSEHAKKDKNNIGKGKVISDMPIQIKKTVQKLDRANDELKNDLSKKSLIQASVRKAKADDVITKGNDLINHIDQKYGLDSRKHVPSPSSIR